MRSQSGFSLVELSIVLVILGLLTGGILGGQALIRAAELRAVNTELSRYQTAVLTFRDKYFALPGDMPNATRFWGALDGNDGVQPDCRGESTGSLTCNGDGNGQVNPNLATSANTYEAFLVWSHLANAGLIEGKYSGSTSGPSQTLCVNPAGVGNMIAGCNVPTSKISTGAWSLIWLGTLTSDSNLFDGNYGNILQLSGTPVFDTNATLRSLFSPEEAWNIDTKFDDGRIGYGSVVSGRWQFCGTGAANQADVANATYRLSSSNKSCTIVLRNAF